MQIERYNNLSLTIKDVRLHKEERMVQGALFGSYTSNYVARFREYPNGIAVVDRLASTMHPDWVKKTEKRSAILSKELAGCKVSVCVTDVFFGKETFEGKIIS
ncbi:MAG: hypothetical protein MJY52_04250 [Bacteroidaceae bacterium]|nr:hypothetical protein [Bacteroidaceae bacterium]